ncbi:MAG TPA: phosphoribosylamine--glycine ligase [Acidimicrobiales bacterium]|nr:phosphoribosylamine--glycine ligase [Acidimicrobiales bacterium]
MATDRLQIGIIGSDARTDCLAAACGASPRAGGLSALAELRNPGLVARTGDRVTVAGDVEPATVLAWADAARPDLVVVGPEKVLAAGAADALATRGIPVFGPVADAARIETSKHWARELVARHAIPGNPRYVIARSRADLDAAFAELGEFAIKPDGLTGGKGVRVHPEHFAGLDGAAAYAGEVISADGEVLIEERLVGQEFTLQTITDGAAAVHCPPVQDHKRAYDGDTGPNTGGMGSYSCADHSLPFLDPADVDAARRINEAVIEAVGREVGRPYRGVLYGGFIATASGVGIIEFNCRFGDPEATNVLPLLEADFAEVALAVAEGRLDPGAVTFRPRASVCKCIVPEGYPENPRRGAAVRVPPELLSDPSVAVFWAACNQVGEATEMTGSRALAIVGFGATLEEAERLAEDACGAVEGPVRHRPDIGTAALVERRVAHMAELRGARTG